MAHFFFFSELLGITARLRGFSSLLNPPGAAKAFIIEDRLVNWYLLTHILTRSSIPFEDLDASLRADEPAFLDT